MGDITSRLPRRPRMVSDVATFVMPDGLGIQFRGAGSPVLLRGEHVEAVLGALLPALEGSRTLDELVALCPPQIPRATILRTLSLLHTKGLLVEGSAAAGEEPPATADPALARQLLFWGRKLGHTLQASSAGEIQRRIETSRLILVGTGVFGAATYDLFVRSGVGDLGVVAWDDSGLLADVANAAAPATSVDAAVAALRERAHGVDLLVTATRNAPAALFEATNRLCLERRIPWLRANENGTDLEIGPHVVPFDSACYACMALREASTHPHAIEEHLYQQHLAGERPGTTAPLGEALATATLGASLVVLEAIRILTRIAAPTATGAVLSVSLSDGTFRTNRILRVPRCPECYRAPGPS